MDRLLDCVEELWASLVAAFPIAVFVSYLAMTFKLMSAPTHWIGMFWAAPLVFISVLFLLLYFKR